jgi:hypothetical protein
MTELKLQEELGKMGQEYCNEYGIDSGDLTIEKIPEGKELIKKFEEATGKKVIDVDFDDVYANIFCRVKTI